MIIVDLPWPNRVLSPNSRKHWGARAKLAKKARAHAAHAALAAGVRRTAGSGVRITATFNPPDARARDVDGMLTSIKPALDGIADVLGIDDSKWAIALVKAEPVRPHGNVSIRIEVDA